MKGLCGPFVPDRDVIEFLIEKNGDWRDTIFNKEIDMKNVKNDGIVTSDMVTDEIVTELAVDEIEAEFEEGEELDDSSYEEVDAEEYIAPEPTLREMVIRGLKSVLGNPAVWYVAGIVDTLLIVTFYLHWLK